MARLGFGLMSLLLWLVAGAAIAQPVGPGPHVRIALLAESEHPTAGSEVTLALASVPEKGWHAYWENPGDAGLPVRAEWTLPKGASIGPLRYPVPQRLTISGLMNYVYEGPFAPLATLKLPEGIAPGTVLPVRVALNYLVCTDSICVPEKADLATTLTIGDGAVPSDARARFDGWRAALPRPMVSEARFQIEGGRLRLAVPIPASAASTDAYFYPRTQDAIDYAAPQTVAIDGDRLVVETAAKGSAPSAIEGVLALPGGGLEIRATPGTVAPAAPPASPWGAALAAFGLAVLGGVLLNIMPCVFPILSLKALSLAKANADERAARRDALAYSAGVILVCLALGGTLLALRAAGSTAGWAFQLQSPGVILGLLLLVTAIALNLAGLFEVTAPAAINRAASSGSGGAFMTGALAAFVATPCTGPFMASALGAALILPWPAALAIFAGLGLGIALPFLLLGYVPALRRRLPKPGGWMVTFRRIMAVPMFATALALAWVLGKQAGTNGMAIGLGAALLLALGLWWVGIRQSRGASNAWLPALPLAATAIGAAFLVHTAPMAAPQAVAGAEPFSESRLAQLVAERRPVFAYFTADWCLTCKVNEKAVIETAAVERALRDAKVAVLVGDWTNGDPKLGRFIEAHNRAGVPLYLWYVPGEAQPRVLPQILSRNILTDLARVPQ